MTKKLFALAVLSAMISVPAIAQETEDDSKLVESLFLEARMGLGANFNEDGSSVGVTGDFLNFNIAGHLTDKLSYRFRQRFTKNPVDKNCILHGTDFAWLTWDIDDKWSLTAGKHPVCVGGYEFDEAPIDLYYCGEFCNKLFQYYTIGVIGGYEVQPGQKLMLQISESPLSKARPDMFAYNLMWRGSFASWWNTTWSVNFIGDEFDKYTNYVSLGNQLRFGNFLWEFDIMNRTGLSQKRAFFGDMSLVSNFEYRLGQVILSVKGGYDYNDAANVDKNGNPYDLAVLPGTEYAYVGGGMEYFPIKDNDNVRIHAMYDWNNLTKTSHFNVGVKWRINFAK